MKNLLLIVLFSTLATSCSTTPNSPATNLDKEEITGKWQLTETLADPGDGSGTWQSVENGKILDFKNDGSVSSSTTYCYDEEIYEASYDTADKIINSDCTDRTITLRYELKDGNLFVYPHNPRCIEACGSKYKKVED